MRGERRIVTTHTGSLPRPQKLEELILAREAGDAADLDDAIRSGVEELVRQQVAAGVDWINHGEASKASYMTYHIDRLSGSETAVGAEHNLEYFDEGMQLDAPDLPGVARMAGTAARALLEERIDLINHAVANIPPEQVRIYVCWGNLRFCTSRTWSSPSSRTSS